MRLLVTGGAGFIGSHVCSKASAMGAETAAFDAFRDMSPFGLQTDAAAVAYRGKLLAKTQIVQGELSDRDLLRRTLADFTPDCVIHLAGLALADIAQTNPTLANQYILQSTIAILEELQNTTVRQFAYVSSSMVYGHFNGAIVDEQAPLRPMNIYGGLKLSGEIVTSSYLHGTNTTFIIIRPSAVYGPGCSGGRVVERFCHQALSGRPITVDGPDTRLDLTYIDDLVEGLCKAITDPTAANETFNMTFGRAHSVAALAECVRACIPSTQITIRQLPSSLRPERGLLDCSKARRMLGFSPSVDLENGIQRYLNHVRSLSLSPTHA